MIIGDKEIQKYIDVTLKGFYEDSFRLSPDLVLNSPYETIDFNDSSHMLNMIIKDLPHDHVLDFGCGDGRWMYYFLYYCKMVDGCDISRLQLEQAEYNLGGLDIPLNLYEVYDKTLDEVPNDTYDAIYSITVFQHIPVYALRRSYLSEFLKKLKPGGYISIHMGGGNITTINNDQWKCADYMDNLVWCRWTNSRYDVHIPDFDVVKQDLLNIGYINADVIVAEDNIQHDLNKHPMFHEKNIVLRGFKP